MRKGQVLTTDYIVAVSIFILIMGFTMYTWGSTLYRARQDYLTLELMNTAKRSSDQLVRTQGRPIDWETNVSSLESLGLASSDRVISQAKFDELAGLDYGDLRRYVGVGGHHVYLKLSLGDDSLLGEAGAVPTGSIVVNSRRIVSVENNTGYLDVIVWNAPTGEVIPVVQ